MMEWYAVKALLNHYQLQSALYDLKHVCLSTCNYLSFLQTENPVGDVDRLPADVLQYQEIVSLMSSIQLTESMPTREHHIDHMPVSASQDESVNVPVVSPKDTVTAKYILVTFYFMFNMTPHHC